MSEMLALIARFVDRLRSAGLAAPTGIPLEQVRQFEARYRVQLPTDMVQFFRCVNGMKPGDLDPENHLRVWALDEIEPLAAQVPEYATSVEDAEHAFVVADFLIWSLGYATWLTPSAVSASPIFLVGDGPPIRIAASFQEFLEMYVDNSPELVPPKPSRMPRQG